MEVVKMAFTPDQVQWIRQYIAQRVESEATRKMLEDLKDAAAKDTDELRLLLRFRKLDVAERKALLLELERKSKIVSIRTAGGG